MSHEPMSGQQSPMNLHLVGWQLQLGPPLPMAEKITPASAQILMRESFCPEPQKSAVDVLHSGLHASSGTQAISPRGGGTSGAAPVKMYERRLYIAKFVLDIFTVLATSALASRQFSLFALYSNAAQPGPASMQSSAQIPGLGTFPSIRCDS